jgi:hypothetical protein
MCQSQNSETKRITKKLPEKKYKIPMNTTVAGEFFVATI